jgi:small subunit ribosomal protein S16
LQLPTIYRIFAPLKKTNKKQKMAVKIRLQRHGKKDRAFFHIVVADSRAPRDGAFIEKLGIYNPTTNPATIDINFDSTLEWVLKGAQPSDTCRAILSYKGVMMKKHLQEGVRKGAITQEAADKKYAAWLGEKEGKINAKKDRLASESQSERKTRLAAEAKAKEVRAAKIAAKAKPAAEEKAEEAAPASEEKPAE